MNVCDRISEAVDGRREMILKAERDIWATPETGYREVKTSLYMEKKFEELGYSVTRAEGITGFYTDVETGREGPTLLVLAELDSVICPAHKDSDKETGAVHSCGHNAQCAALLGVAAALKEEDILSTLCGKIRLCVVPAEEFIELDYRKELKNKGIIKYLGGKLEYLYRGYFDGVNLAFMVHTNDKFFVVDGANGFIAKSVVYKGRSAHAGGAPWLGVNALYAANLGLNAVNAIRETFKEPDLIRFHPIITSGGSIVNAIPETARIESYVRGSSFASIEEANSKINRALVGAALSIGANVEISDIHGYSPYENSKDMIEVCKDAFGMVCPEGHFDHVRIRSAGSTDMGELACIMPMVHPYAGGAVGKAHGDDYEIEDPESACVISAKWQVMMIELLMKDGAQRAKRIVEAYKPPFASKEEYLKYVDSASSSCERIVYNDDGTASVICK